MMTRAMLETRIRGLTAPKVSIEDTTHVVAQVRVEINTVVRFEITDVFLDRHGCICLVCDSRCSWPVPKPTAAQHVEIEPQVLADPEDS